MGHSRIHPDGSQTDDVTSKLRSDQAPATSWQQERSDEERQARRRVRQARSDDNLRNRNLARRQQKRTKSGEAIADEWRQPGRVLPQVSAEELEEDVDDLGLMVRLSENLHDEVLTMKSERTTRLQRSAVKDAPHSNVFSTGKNQASSSSTSPNTPESDDDDQEENEAWEDVEMAVGADNIKELEIAFHLFMNCLDFPARARAVFSRRQSPHHTVPNGLVRVATEGTVMRGEDELLAEDAEDLADLAYDQLAHFPRIAREETEKKLQHQAWELEQAAKAPEMLQQLYEDVLCTSMDFMSQVARQKVVGFHYKQRKHKGRAIHVAALHWDGMQLLNRLLLLNIDVGQECTFCVYDSHRGAAQALHLAAGCGNHDVIRELIRRNVNVDVKTKQQCREHYTALHEATFFQLYSTVDLLLRLKASPNPQNLHGLTPLHLAAKNGNHQIAKMLLASGADVKSRNNNEETPLVMAIEEGRFPNQKLHHLAERSIEDVLQVARLSPIAAADLMRDTSSNSKNRAVHPSWREALTKEHVSTEVWIDLLKLAPQAAEDLLDAVTAVPCVENKNHHPLPRQAFIRSRQIVRCHYTSEEKWSFNADRNQAAPAWHRKLAPMQQHKDNWMSSITPPKACSDVGRAITTTRSTASNRPMTPVSTFTPAVSEASSIQWSSKTCFSFCFRGLYELVRSSFHGNAALTPVRIKIVRLSGLLSIQVLHALATTPHMRVFRKVAVRAIVDHIWNKVVVGAYITQVFYRVFELILLALYVHKWRYSDDIWYREAAWSLLAVSALRDMFYEVTEIIGVTTYLRKRHADETPLDVVRSGFGALLTNYISDIKNVFDFLSVFMLGALLFFTACSGTNPDSVLKVDENKATLALVVSCRWFQLLYTFRAFKFMGYQLVPIMQSFWPVSGMILITVFMFIGFWHAFLALSDNPGDGSVLYATFVPTFRFLFLGDGDGIDQAQAWLEPSGYAYSALGLIACTIVFSVWILNLFIALISEAYDHAKELSKTTFQQERATICLQHLLRPAFHKPPLEKFTRWRPLLLTGVAAVTLLAWLFLLRVVARFVDGSLFGLLALLLPTLLLLALVLFGDALLMTHQWQDSLWNDNAAPKYLWICHRADYDEARFWPSELSTGQMYGTLTGLKHDSMVRSQRVHDEITTFKQKQDNFEVNMNSRLVRLEQRMDAFLHKLDRALPVNCMDGVSQPYPSLSPSSFGAVMSPSRRSRAKSRALSRASSPMKTMTRDRLLNGALSSTPSELGNDPNEPQTPAGGTPVGGGTPSSIKTVSPREAPGLGRPPSGLARTLLPADLVHEGAVRAAQMSSDPACVEESVPVPPPAVAESIPDAPATAPAALNVNEHMAVQEPLPVPAAKSGGFVAPPVVAEATPEGGTLPLMQSEPGRRVAEALDNGLEEQLPSRGPPSPSTDIIVRLD